MNPWGLDATGLMLWGLIAHLIADWPLQNDWMARHKAARRTKRVNVIDGFDPYAIAPDDVGGFTIGGRVTASHWEDVPRAWWDRHPAAYVHACIHGVLLAVVFGWVAVPLALVHLIVDTRAPVAWWSRLMRQTQPANRTALAQPVDGRPSLVVLYDIGTEVRFWTDQVFHVATVAAAALVVAGVG